MTTLTGTDGLNTVFSATLFGDLAPAELAAEDLFDLKTDQIDVFDETSTFSPSIQTATHLFGTDSAANGTLELFGTGFTGTTGPNSLATKGTVTHAIFTGDDGSGFDVAGNVAWTYGNGLGKGTLTHFISYDAAGNTFEAEGKITTGFDNTDDTLVIIGGSLTYQRITTASGLTFEATGNFAYQGSTGTVNSISADDGAGHSVTITGKYTAAVFGQALGGSPTLGDFFTNPLFFTGNDRLDTNDSNHSWHAGAGNDIVNGGASAGDKLFGDAGNDTLDGGLLADTMVGGLGDDIYYVDNVSDLVSEVSGEGKDTVFSSIDVNLADNAENLTLTGTAVTGSGNSGNNVVTGTAGDNTLDGGPGGVDTLIGGAGNDYYIVFDSTTKITDSAGHDSLLVYANSYTAASGIDEIHAYAFADVLTLVGNTGANFIEGNSGVNTLLGGTGDDTLDGAGGNDRLDGGAGDDVYYVYGSETIVDANGNDTVNATASYTLATGLENLNFELAVGDVDGTGNASANVIIGNDGVNTLTGLGGNDTMDGGAGDDVLIGGLGNDTYVIDSAGDVVSEGVNGGTDTVFAGLDYDLLDNFEILIATSSGHSLGGNAGANTIIGSFGTDFINGGAGADKMIGGDGDDVYYVDNAKDTITEGVGGGNDTVHSSVDYTLGSYADVLELSGAAVKGTGSKYDDTIIGHSGTNTLSGQAGNDTLNGYGGTDVLTGGIGNDVFHMSVAGNATVTDFNKTQDTINIHDLVTGYDDGEINDYIHVVSGPGGTSVLQIDLDGATGGFTQGASITVKGAFDLQALLDSGHLVL